MAPVLIENNIKEELPVISQAVVVGDRRKFLSILLTLKVNISNFSFELNIQFFQFFISSYYVMGWHGEFEKVLFFI